MLFIALYQERRRQIILSQREESSGSGRYISVIYGALSEHRDYYKEHSKSRPPIGSNNVGISYSSGLSPPKGPRSSGILYLSY